MLFLCVYYNDYEKSLNLKKHNMTKENGEPHIPTSLTLSKIRKFLNSEDLFTGEHMNFIGYVQVRRNSIHALKKQDIGDYNNFIEAIIKYKDFVKHVDMSLPYP